jgi:hypothetical protein
LAFLDAGGRLCRSTDRWDGFKSMRPNAACPAWTKHLSSCLRTDRISSARQRDASEWPQCISVRCQDAVTPRRAVRGRSAVAAPRAARLPEGPRVVRNGRSRSISPAVVGPLRLFPEPVIHPTSASGGFMTGSLPVHLLVEVLEHINDAGRNRRAACHGQLTGTGVRRASGHRNPG